VTRSGVSNQTPLVSVYWISGFRGAAVVDNAVHFLKKTEWERLELVVVDWSSKDDHLQTREKILKSNIFDSVVLRDGRYCVFNNNNFAMSKCKGEVIVRFEDDVRLRDDISADWLAKIVARFQLGLTDDVSLWSPNCSAPPTLASVSFLGSGKTLPAYDSFPENFSTVAESMRRGGGAFTEKYRRSGRIIEGQSLVETSLSLPSRNLSVLRDFAGYSWQSIEDLAKRGIAVERMPDEAYVGYERYRELGGWEKMEWTVLGQPRSTDQIQTRLNLGRRVQPFVVNSKRMIEAVLRKPRRFLGRILRRRT